MCTYIELGVFALPQIFFAIRYRLDLLYTNHMQFLPKHDNFYIFVYHLGSFVLLQNILEYKIVNKYLSFLSKNKSHEISTILNSPSESKVSSLVDCLVS